MKIIVIHLEAPVRAQRPRRTRTRRISSRIKQAAPMVMPLSATLNAGKCMPLQWESHNTVYFGTSDCSVDNSGKHGLNEAKLLACKRRRVP
jgi:hypothetical protein